MLSKRDAYGLGAIGGADFFKNVIDMIFYAANGNSELECNILIGKAKCERL